MNVRPKLIVLTLLTLLALAEGTTRAADRLLATFDGQSIWLAEVTNPAKKDAPATRLFTRAYRSETEFRFAGTLVARVRTMVPCPEGVAILCEDGQWLLGWLDGQSTGALPADGAQLLAFGGDGKTLWAVAVIPPGAQPLRATTTRNLLEDASTTAPSAPSATTKASATTSPAALPTTQPAAPALYRLDRDQWTRVIDLPIAPGTAADDLALVVSEGVPTVGIREGKTVRLLTLDDGAVRQAAWILVASDNSLFTLTLRSGEIRLMESITRGLQMLTGNGETIRLEMDGDRPVTASAALIEAQGIRLFALTSKVGGKATEKAAAGASGDTIYERSYTLAGVPDKQGVPLQMQSLPPDENVVDLVSFAVVISLTTVLVFAARSHGPVTSKAVRKAGFRLAPLLPRVAAGLIDAVPILTALALHRANFATYDLLLLARLLAGDRWLWGALAIYVVHTGVSEWLFGRSIGKWLLGLRVASTDGTPAKPLAVLYRTLVRPAELLVPFSLLLIPLTLLRQRPGDIAAGTVVVATAKQGDEEDDLADDEDDEE